MGIEIRAEKEPWSGKVELLVLRREGDRVIATADDVVMSDLEPGARPRSTISLDGHMAQMLMDDLWRCGIRPSEGSGSAGQLAATQKHLEHVSKTHDRMLDLIFDKARRDDFDALHRGWQQLEKAQAKQGRV